MLLKRVQTSIVVIMKKEPSKAINKFKNLRSLHSLGRAKARPF